MTMPERFTAMLRGECGYDEGCKDLEKFRQLMTRLGGKEKTVEACLLVLKERRPEHDQ